MKTGVLLINLGTPDSPQTADVRRYLREFLMDGRVIDIPFWQRWLLINLIIAPFRAPQSAKGYKELWTAEGSPLKVYGYKVVDLLAKALGRNYEVALGMRYQNPSIKSALMDLKNRGVGRLIVIPLYPQYASASTGSSIEQFFQDIRAWEIIPTIDVISQFFEERGFIETFATIGQEWMSKTKYDHVVFSYHGLPQRQILKGSVDQYCRLSDCCATFHKKNQYCYRAQCFETSRLLAKALQLNPEQYTVCFQSRLGKDPWVKPYTDEVIPELVQKGYKKVLVFSPSFIADCLETTIEIGVEYKHQFTSLGGEEWDMVPSLNDHPLWIECLRTMVQRLSP